MQIKKIFLASSEELKDDRRAFELMIGRLNQQWRQRGYMFDLVVWEYFIDAISREGLQKEYNKAIQECDVFIMMFFTKVGQYTLEEFETAFADMASGSGPYIYTYFKNDYILTGDIDDSIKSLLEFKAKLRALNHYVTEYRNTEDLQWQFSRQLEMLYGSESASSVEITDSTPKEKAGEVALVLCYQQIFGGDEPNQVDIGLLQSALQRASKFVRNAVFNLAYEVRRENWAVDKDLMERTIPVFEALIRVDPNWHHYHGQLGYALKDKLVPDWQRAKLCLDRAVELRGDRNEASLYQYNRLLCAIHLDANHTGRKPADAATRNTVLDILKQAKRDVVGIYEWENILQWPESVDIRIWLQLNESTPKR